MATAVGTYLHRFRRSPLAITELALAAFLASALVMLIIFRDALLTYDPMQGQLLQRLKPIGTVGHWLGTDHLGRDQWSRVLSGLRWSMACALTANLISFVIGTGLGLMAAERDGFIRKAVNQIVAMFQSFPGLIVAICVVVVAGHGFWPLVLTLGFLSWPVYARVVYAEAGSLVKRDYVLAAHLAGVGRVRILLTHVLPGLRPTLMVVFAFHFSDMLIAESALSFLGIGAPLGVPTWGNMLAESRNYLFNAPWMLIVPAGAIIIAVVTMNLLGDGLAALSRQQGRGIDL